MIIPARLAVKAHGFRISKSTLIAEAPLHGIKGQLYNLLFFEKSKTENRIGLYAWGLSCARLKVKKIRGYIRPLFKLVNPYFFIEKIGWMDSLICAAERFAALDTVDVSAVLLLSTVLVMFSR